MTARLCNEGHPMTPDNIDARGRCRECMRAYGRARYAADPQRQRQATQRWRSKSPERVKELEKGYRVKHRAKPGVIEAERAQQRERLKDPVVGRMRRDYARQYRADWRARALEAYGNACACCGSTRKQHLAIDHVDGGGNEHRREIGGSTAGFLRWLYRQGYPPTFQILCHNCNFEKHIDGRCACQDELPQLTGEVIDGARSA